MTRFNNATTPTYDEAFPAAVMASPLTHFVAARARLRPSPKIAVSRPIERLPPPPKRVGHTIYRYAIGPRLRIFSGANARMILGDVAVKYRLFESDITGGLRFGDMVTARHETMWRLRTELGWSFPRIGLFVGGRDHSTVMYGVRKHQKRLDRATMARMLSGQSEPTTEGAPPG